MAIPPLAARAQVPVVIEFYSLLRQIEKPRPTGDLLKTPQWSCSRVRICPLAKRIERSQDFLTLAASTLDRYGHVLPGMQEKAAAKLEAILFGR